MRLINPLMLLLLSITIFLISFKVLDQSNEALNTSMEELNKYSTLSSKYHTLNQNWTNSKDKQRKLDKIIRQAKIKNIQKIESSKDVILTITNEPVKKVDKLLNKILNSNFEIIKYSVSKEKVTLQLGYKKWKLS